MFTRIDGKPVLALTQAAQLSAQRSEGKLPQGEINLLNCLFDTKNGPSIISGGHVIDTEGVRSLKFLLRAINQRRGFSQRDVEAAFERGALIMPSQYRNEDSTVLQVEDIHHLEDCEGPLVRGPNDRDHHQFLLNDLPHTGFYRSSCGGTIFYWQWIPEFEEIEEQVDPPMDRLVGGKLEIVGHMTEGFIQFIPTALIVQ
jgi:hypothetical protein